MASEISPIARLKGRLTSSGTARVWGLTCLVTLAALGLFIWERDLAAIYTGFKLRWFHLAAVFFLSEVTVVHLRFRRDAHSFSMSEIPLVVGLFFVAPIELIARLDNHEIATDPLILVVDRPSQPECPNGRIQVAVNISDRDDPRHRRKPCRYVLRATCR